MSKLRFDLFVLADIRVGDVAAPCHAAALAAVADAGYRVGVLPVLCEAISTDPFRIDPHYAALFQQGTVTQVGPNTSVQCKLALALDNRIFRAPLHASVLVTATHRVVTVERPLSIARRSRLDLNQMAMRAKTALGGAVTWAPTTSMAREALASFVPDWSVSAENWYPVAPTFEVGVRSAAEASRPVVGAARISRARPDAAGSTVSDRKTLFGTPLVSWKLRTHRDRTRINWPNLSPVEIWQHDTISIQDFLNKLDILANHDVAENDPCPVEALMAIRAGVIPYLSSDHRPTFGAAAVYGTPQELPRLAIDLQDDRGFVADLRANGQHMLDTAFSGNSFVNLISKLVDAPRADAFAPAVHTHSPTCVVFYSSNGVGMGHLTRQLAIARRLPDRIKPVFVSHSQAVDVARAFGFAVEYIPYHAAYGQARAHWNAALTETLSSIFAFYRASALVYDGNIPYLGLVRAFNRMPALKRIWVRRGMWGAGRDSEALKRGSVFDVILEPSEVEPMLDDGPTAALRSDVRAIPPIRILDTSEHMDRGTACDQLGLDPNHINVLLSPGSGNNFDTGQIARSALDKLSAVSGVGIAVAQWKIANESVKPPPHVAVLDGYPFSRFHKAFDLAVAAAGYNTFVEHVAAALPTIWVPNEHAQQDLQIVRAKYAKETGIGSMVRVSEPQNLPFELDTLLDTQNRAATKQRGEEFAARETAENGAFDASRIIAQLCDMSVAR